VGLPVAFEGGQLRIAQRLPKLRGFNNVNRKEFAVVNLGKLNRFEAGTEVGPQLLAEIGLVKKELDGIKILASGELKVALKVSAHRVSKGARQQIEAAGGSVELIGPQPEPRTAPKPRKAKAVAEEAAAPAGDVAEAAADEPAASVPTVGAAGDANSDEQREDAGNE
jgi:ribosomal protein L15